MSGYASNLLFRARVAGLINATADDLADRERQAELLSELEANPGAAAFLLANNYRPRRKLTKPKPTEVADNLTVFVLGHRRKPLASIGDAPHVRKVYLHDISWSERRLAESRIFLSHDLLNCPSEYVGLASASWNKKYDGETRWHGRLWPHCLPVERLNELELSPAVVWAAALTDNEHWSHGLDCIFRGIDSLVWQVARRFGLRHVRRVGVLANNVVGRRSVMQGLVRWMRTSIAYLDGKYGPVWPVQPDRCGMFADRLPAFMCEALSILWWANQTDLEIRQIPAP